MFFRHQAVKFNWNYVFYTLQLIILGQITSIHSIICYLLNAIDISFFPYEACRAMPTRFVTAFYEKTKK